MRISWAVVRTVHDENACSFSKRMSWLRSAEMHIDLNFLDQSQAPIREFQHLGNCFLIGTAGGGIMKKKEQHILCIRRRIRQQIVNFVELETLVTQPITLLVFAGR